MLCTALAGLIVVLAGALLAVTMQMHDNLGWLDHSSRVLRTANHALSSLRTAESGQRGFTLTRDPDFARAVGPALDTARRDAADLVNLTADKPEQNERARQLQALVAGRADTLEAAARLARSGQFDQARQSTASRHGLELMQLVEAKVNDLLLDERALAADRMAAVESLLRTIRWLVILGTPLTLLMLALVARSLIQRIRRPAGEMLAVMGELGAGHREARITGEMGSREFAQLASGYNAMADELQRAVANQAEAAESLKTANAALSRNADTLRERGEVIEILGGMAHRMQAARTDEELAAIIEVFVPRVLPQIPGALFVHNNSRNLLVPTATWGGLEQVQTGFAPEECWALRRGQSHFVDEAGSDIVCPHVGVWADHYHCEPLLAGGEVIGVLYLRGTVGTESRFRLAVLSENIASALVNHRLQRGLREQTIRDPLTGLFNRRYLEETLALEMARAARSGAPLTVVMCDVDHFKRFNDEFGHDAGDQVLQTVAAELRRRFRDGDVVCRFGGEEFVVIAPATEVSILRARVEEVREAVSHLTVRQGERALGSVTMSFGLATWAPDMDREGIALLKAADAALYAAKREGRNRVAIDPQALAA
ncbi:diguanylate cyclase [Novosphingobium pokkalii]|uniref:diguanylate cyclase n=1 Tax=Novosphingobium pokkalii TaxID=1770194 RepID=A0ABV7VAJ5_9SPHN|nr:diguanylate cyclase [Novosphingobium pokkalii]GHC85970.1 sensor histidine kinase [Novosphingobium pokkalii]